MTTKGNFLHTVLFKKVWGVIRIKKLCYEILDISYATDIHHM